MTTWTDIERDLRALERELPELIRQYGESACQAWADRCDPILERAHAAGYDLWHSATVLSTDILIAHGLVDESERQH